MKKWLLSLFAIVFLSFAAISQTVYVPAAQVRNIAEQKASALWTSVSSSEPLAYYTQHDELIGYRYTFAINKPFPEKRWLMEQCRQAYDLGDRKAQWGIDEYGTIFIGARKDIAVIQDHANLLSPEYAFGLIMEEKAKQQIGGDVTLVKAYYIDFQNQWFCYSNGSAEIYIKVFPEIKAVDKAKFHSIVDSKPFFCAQGDFSSEWDEFLTGTSDGPAAQVWIPNHDGNCRFYDWSYGCSPTAAAMLLSYWDYTSIIYSNNYAKLIDYYFQRWDGIQGETDYQVPNANKELAIAMNTDTISSGGTDRVDIAPGYTTVCNTNNGYNFTCTHHDHGTDYVWYFAKIVSEIGTYDRPVHISIPGHSECCVAYDEATNMIGVHNTWYEGVQWISRTQLERVYTIVPGGAEGYAIELTYPLGDVIYNHNGSGESLYAGDVYEITWDYDYAAGSWVRIYYSVNGGYNWTTIVSNTPNDGAYDWVIPAGLNSTTCRIRVNVYNSSNLFSGADASLGNFKIYSGGSIQSLAEDSWATTDRDPDYFQFTSTAGYWNVVGVRPNVSGENWDMRLYDDLTFTDILATSAYGASQVDFVVVDGNHTSSVARGIKVNRYSGTGTGRVEFEGGTDLLSYLTPMTETWTTGDVVEMWDVYLPPGYYKCSLLINSGTANMGMALYGSSGAAYYAGRGSYLAIADSYGAGADESFGITITTADYYGLCIFANDANAANITIKFETPGQWLGTVSNNWHTAANWSASYIPTATTDVLISTGYTFYPIVSSGTGLCNNITIESGTILSIGSADLSAAGNMTIQGQIEQTNANADFFVTGNVYWESGSTATISSGEFHVDGDWEFRNGANAVLANGSVYFSGSSTSFIKSYETNCAFRNIVNSKTAGSLYYSSASTDTLKINGNYSNTSSDAILYFNTNYPLVLKGQLSNSGHIYCPYGTFIFDGTTHSINLNTGDYFNNVILSSTGDVSLSDTLRVNGDLTINSGALVAGIYPILIGGDWDNNVGSAGFNEGTGKVVFNGGNYHQYCSSETFNTLEVDKSLGGAFRVSSATIVCQNYDWTAGAVDVLSGSFTANNLIDSGIKGNFYLNPGGTINLHNTDSFVDLNGFLYIYGGNFNVYGGSGSDSFWPFTSNGGITMSGGTLDFKDVGIFVFNSGAYTLAENITNGTIKTARGFSVERSDYTPAGGIVEFCGAADGNFHTINGGYVHSVTINKSWPSGSTVPANPVIGSRENQNITDALLARTISINNTADIKGNVIIENGVLSAGNQTIYVAGNWNNMVGTAGFSEGTSTVFFNGAASADILSAETFYNLNLNKTYTDFDGLELMGDVGCLHDVHLYDGTMELESPANLNIAGNLVIDLNAGLNANDGYGPLVYVGGNWNNANTSYSPTNGFDPGDYSTVIFNGAADQILSTSCTSESFNKLTIDKSSGKFRPNDNIVCFNDMLISQGIWEDNVSSVLHHVFYRNFTVHSSGSFLNAFPLNTVEFTGSQNSLLTYSSGTGYFHNLLINKTTGTGVTQVGATSCQFEGNLTVENGTYNLNGYYLGVFGDIAVNDAGILYLPAGSLLTLSDLNSLNVNLGGTIEIDGLSANNAMINANVGGARYNLNVNSGGTIAADYCQFTNMGTNGVYLAPGSTADPAHAFTGCTFRDGAAGGTLLKINNSQVLTVHNAVFPTNTWGGTSNVSKTLNSGHLYFLDFSGGFSGEAYDDDAFNLIDWVATLTATAEATPVEICAGASSQLNVTTTGGLAPFNYLWTPSTGLSNPNIANPVASPAETTTYNVTVTDALGSIAVSSVEVTVLLILPVSISITASANPVPPETYVTFTATPFNGGTLPAYQWKVNGVNVGTGLPTYSYTPSYNDQVTCVLTSNYPCVSGNPATSNMISMIVVNTNTTVTGTVPSPLTVCFDAINTVTVAGGGNTFIVQSGGSAIMIAGVNILYLPGVEVQPGGYMHGYITTTNAFCGSLLPSMVAVLAGEEEIPAWLPVTPPAFSIYPNPTTGRFTLLDNRDQMSGTVQVIIFDIRGNNIFSTSFPGERSHAFMLDDVPPGLYIVKLVSGDYVASFKLILTR